MDDILKHGSRQTEIERAIDVCKWVLKSAMETTCDVCKSPQDPKLALQAQKELSALLRLNEDAGHSLGDAGDARLAPIMEWLAPLFPDIEDIDELARQAANEISRYRAKASGAK
jgi:hypothetical protein